MYGFPNSSSLCSSDGNKLMFSSCFQHWNFIVSRVYAPLLIVEKMSNREWTSFFFVALFWAKKLSWYMDILRQLFRSMVGADGWCIHYDKPSRSCTIHNGMDKPSHFVMADVSTKKLISCACCSPCLDWEERGTCWSWQMCHICSILDKTWCELEQQ